MFTLPSGNLIDYQSDFSSGISDFDKNGKSNEYGFGRSIDYRSNPYELTLLPKTTKESSSVVVDLPKDGDLVGAALYYYGSTGNIYKRTSAGVHSLQRTAPNSHGNGMKYYTEDDYLYYTTDTTIGRYGQANGSTPTWSDDFLGAEGGVPLNTYALDLESSSSQYGSKTDTASLSITGNLTMECSIKPESLPTAGNSMVLVSKWDINVNKRSYKFEIYAAAGYFGDGSDGALTISADTTEAPIDSACTGTTSTTSLSATNVSFASGQYILIHQTVGASGAGTMQKNKIIAYTAGTITTETPLNATYTTGAQVRVLKQYSSVTINSGKVYSAKAWNGTVGGIIAFLCSGTITATGTISANGKGYRGGNPEAVSGTPHDDQPGEGQLGYVANSINANGVGGGGGQGGNGLAGGGGGGNGTAGSSGTTNASASGGIGGSTGGTVDLTTIIFGGGGGAGGADATSSAATGGTGGGIVFIGGVTVTVSGAITATGDTPANSAGNGGGGGGGGGGSILIKCGGVATLGTTLVTAVAGGAGGSNAGGAGGAGGAGRIHLDYLTSSTGTTSPTIDALQDLTLTTNITYQLRLGLSSNGTAEEFLTKACTLVTGTWFHVAVNWTAASHLAEFFQDGVSLGTASGAVTSLNDNASVFGVGADFNLTARNFYDGLIDEVRLWNTVRTVDQILGNKGMQIATTTTGLQAYYQFNNAATDGTSNANDLTLANSPAYTTDVPFSSPTNRQDLDQSLDTSGNTYALTTAISETAVNRQTFTPNKDPQKSIEVNITDTGDDSDWTLTVHDSLNRVVASATITHANLRTGDNEFIFSSVWRPVRGANYHFHLTATTTTGTPLVLSTTSNDLETADFHTYYQFLVDDADYHPIEQMLNFILIGNERYVAKYAADGVYEPHKLVLPSGWRVRCFAFWRGYIVIGCWKGTNIYDTDQGIFFLWDGISDTYDDYRLIPQGGINAMFGEGDDLHIWAGYHGDKYVFRGGGQVDKDDVKRIPKMTNDVYAETMPKAVTMWNSLLRWGSAGNSDSSLVERGVYTYGKTRGESAPSLSYDYPISTGSRATTNVKIGFVFPVAKKLLIGWQDNTSYGMDVVDPAGSVFTTGTIEKFITDNGAMWKDKKALTLRADFKTLVAGQTVKLKYRLDRASSWIEGATSKELGYGTTGDSYARLQIPMGDYRELEVAADLATSISTSPTLRGFGTEINPNKAQGAF